MVYLFFNALFLSPTNLQAAKLLLLAVGIEGVWILTEHQ